MNKETRHTLIGLTILCLIVAFMFGGSCQQNKVLFSNDGPLGVTAADWYDIDIGQPKWVDTHWIGAPGGVQPAGITEFLHLLWRHPMDFIEAATCIVATFLYWVLGTVLHKYTSENRKFLLKSIIWTLLMYQGMVFSFRAVFFIIYH